MLVFQRFNHKPSEDSESSALKLPLMYIRLSLLKYNLYMAQITKWLPTIWNYMKRAKLKISTSVPPPCNDVFKLLIGQVGLIVGFFYTAPECAILIITQYVRLHLLLVNTS